MNKLARFYIFLLMIRLFSSVNVLASIIEDDERPHEHVCPITYEVMKDPVVASDGHTYERSAILQHFQTSRHPRSPLTGLPLDNTILFANQALKIMIQEWKPGNKGIPSVLASRSVADLAKKIREEFTKNKVLLDAAKGHHIVAFLGNTGAGKSTLINMLAGKEMRVSDEGDYILANPNDSTAMVIGTSGNSETLYPKFIDVGMSRFFDLPGFNDTEGSERNLMNAAFIRKILLDAESVRLVIVAGQDQFTADRSASVKQMFNSLKHLFVVGEAEDLIKHAVFVATKVLSTHTAELTEVLLKKTDSKDKADLHQQLRSWQEEGRSCRVFHSFQAQNNQDVTEKILEKIKGARLSKIHGINVSALYPSETKDILERLFLSIFKEYFETQCQFLPVSLSEYNKAIEIYSAQDFVEKLQEDICRKDEAIGFLKDFSSIPYSKALKSFKEDSQKALASHLQHLKGKRENRVKDIEARTEHRIREIIDSSTSKVNDEFMTFDFAYYPHYYSQVCGEEAINKLATDPQEQDVVRRAFTKILSQHIHNQMMNWFEQFGNNTIIKDLTCRINQLGTAHDQLVTGLRDTQNKLQISQERQRAMRIYMESVEGQKSRKYISKSLEDLKYSREICEYIAEFPKVKEALNDVEREKIKKGKIYLYKDQQGQTLIGQAPVKQHINKSYSGGSYNEKNWQWDVICESLKECLWSKNLRSQKLEYLTTNFDSRMEKINYLKKVLNDYETAMGENHSSHSDIMVLLEWYNGAVKLYD